MVEDDEQISEQLREERDEAHHAAGHPLLLHALAEEVRDYASRPLSSPTQRVRSVENSGQIEHPGRSEGGLVHGVGQISEDVRQTHSVVDHDRQRHHQLHRLAQQTQRGVDRHRLPFIAVRFSATSSFSEWPGAVYAFTLGRMNIEATANAPTTVSTVNRTRLSSVSCLITPPMAVPKQPVNWKME